MVNDVRMRFLEGVPEGNVTQLSLPYDADCYQGNEDHTKNVHFSVVQQSSEKVPVFLLPATEKMTVQMSDEQRNQYMQNVFNNCYVVYRSDCENKGKTPVDIK